MDSLPKEIWLHIFNLLDGCSLLAIEDVCVAFSEWLSDDLFWFMKCRRALASVPSAQPLCSEISECKCSWRMLYINLISPYKHLFGYWQLLAVGDELDGQANTGALLKFFILPKLGLIYGQMSEYAEHEQTYRFTNALIIHSDGELSSHRTVERYPFGISKEEQLPIESCFVHRPPDDHSLYLNHVYSSHVIEFEGLTDRDPTRWLKLKPLSSFDGSVLKAGVFTATYDFYGTEHIHVCQLTSERLIVGTKLHGDHHVPYGKHTFVIDLSKPLVPTLSEQETCESLVQVLPTSGSAVNQPFRLPDDLRDIEGEYPYNHSIARYAGKITYAYNNYERPSYHNVHYIQFTEDVFAVLAVERASILLFTRYPQMTF